ncbi:MULTISPECIES: hypothetical protein [Shewanella]|uniref:hypothetical protein n=1 Tax=Shewanella TaxID=22 RepID=UPI002006DD98|nr:hypothetical protein [Shewanella sp. DNRA4]
MRGGNGEGPTLVMNMKALRLGLYRWGRYWGYQELGKGFSNRSACDRLGEALGVTNLKHELNVPAHVAHYDHLVEQLSINCKRAIRTHYLCKEQWALMGFDSKKSYIFWLRKAEMALLDRMN